MADRRPPGARAARFEPPATDPGLATIAAAGAPVEADPQPVREALTSTDPLRSVAPVNGGAPPRRTSLHPGVLLDGRYQLQRHISSRAEVQLWQGEDRVLARPVAIRLLVDDASPAAAAGSRALLDAARRSGQLVHNGAASTYDATTTSADGLPLAYVVSEWVSGISLLDLLRDGPLAPERAATVMLSVARVVAAAHAAGVTHGDLHPGDVIITAHGLIKVLDLEMRAVRAARSPQEQRARDVTSLGALLYACLTARWPLGTGRGLPAAERDPNGLCRSPRQLRAGVPRELDGLAMAALGPASGSVLGRPQPTAADIVAALETMASDLPAGARPALDDGPEAHLPGARSAQAEQAERLARARAARQRTIRRRVLPVALLVVLALGAWLIGVAVGKLPGHPGGGGTLSGNNAGKPTGAQLPLQTVTDFDPLGDAQEDPQQVPYAHDNNLATSWATENYAYRQWGGSATKTGVGLRVDLGRAVVVSQVRLWFTQPGTTVELRFNDTESASLDSYTLAASTRNPTAEQVLVPRTGPHRYWLIWLTALPEQPGPPPQFSAHLAEMKFYG